MYSMLTMKFSYKLIVTMLSISVSAVLLFSIIQYSSSSRYILALEKKNLTDKSLIIQKQMDYYLKQTGNFIKGLSTNTQIIQYLTENSTITLKTMNDLLDRIQSFAPDEYSAVFIVDKIGTCRASTDRRFIGVDYSFRSYYQNVINKKSRLFVSDYSIGLRSLIPGIFFSVPLEDRDGSFIGGLVVKISGAYLQRKIEELNDINDPTILYRDDIDNVRLLKHIEMPDLNPESFIINRDGIIIMHPDHRRLFRSTMPLSKATEERLKKNQQFLDREITSLNEPVLEHLHQQALVSRQTTASIYRNHKESNWNVLVLTPMEKNGWCVGVSLSYEELQLSSRELLLKTILMSLIILAVVIVAALYLSKVITKPINHLLSNIQDAMQKNWSTRYKSHENNEFAFLGDRFNEMMNIIEDYSDNMEQQIRERTNKIISLQKENTRLKIIEEKERMYRDLHDSLGARITNINICNTVAQSSLNADLNHSHEMLQRISANCDQAIEDMKRLIDEGTEELLNEVLFGPEMIERLRKRLNVQSIRFETSIQDRDTAQCLDKHLQREIILVLEEIITNVLKHSQASKTSLRVLCSKNEMDISFSDNGVGIDRKQNNRGYGLGNIEKRISRLNAKMTIETSPSTGTHYRILIPIKQAGEIQR